MNSIHKCNLITAFQAAQRMAHETAVEKGWYEQDRNDAELIALMHAELSEALEALRDGNPPDKHLPHIPSVEAKLADVVIRIMDMAGLHGYDIGTAIVDKMEYNKTRPILVWARVTCRAH